MHGSGHPSLLEPCENALNTQTLFETTKHDNKLSETFEEKQFKQIMSVEMNLNLNGNWEAPLPFKE